MFAQEQICIVNSHKVNKDINDNKKNSNKDSSNDSSSNNIY